MVMEKSCGGGMELAIVIISIRGDVFSKRREHLIKI